jgi:hypothetical protein
MQSLLFWVFVFLPPMISGPLPAVLVFRAASGLNWRRGLLLALLSAVILNLLAFIIINTNLYGLFDSGSLACGLTPLAALATMIFSLRRFRRSAAVQDADSQRQKSLRLSLAAIPLLQILMLTILVLIGPALCTTGLRSCPRF